MAPSSNYGIVSPPYWDEVVIVAGGPTAHSFDFSAVRGRVLAVNDAILLLDHLKTAVAVFSLDHRWIRRHRDFLCRFEGEKYLALPLETWPDCGGIPGATYLQWSHADGLSEDPGFICTGYNSGYGAINLCTLKGARIIHLVGYDMDPASGEKFNHWIPRFRTMLPQLREKGIMVLNHNPSSFIDAFPKVNPNETYASSRHALASSSDPVMPDGSSLGARE